MISFSSSEEKIVAFLYLSATITEVPPSILYILAFKLYWSSLIHFILEYLFTSKSPLKTFVSRFYAL